MTQDDVMQLFIAKDGGAGTPTTSAGSPIIEASDTYLLDGEVCVTNSHNIVLSAASVLTDDLVAQHGCKVIQRSGSSLFESDLIKQNDILNYRGETGAVAAEQVTYMGFNGVSAGSIEVNNSTLYVTRLELKELDTAGQGQELILNWGYKSDASATQEEIANGLVLLANSTLSRQAVPPVRVDLVNKNAVDNADAFDANATVVKGSKTFSVLTNLNAGGVAAVVGDYVRFSETPAVTGTALTDGIYKITEINTLNVTVDRPIQTPSGSYTASKAVAEVITNAEAVATDFGLKFTGIARTFSMPKRRYSKVSFNLGLDDGFGATLVTYTTAMSLGAGTYEQIAELEWNLLGNVGDIYRGDFMYTRHKTDAVSGATYSTLNMNYFGDHPTQGVGATPRRQKQLIIAFTKGFADTEASDIVIEVFDAYTTVDSGISL